jgi:type IV secretory pathway TrbF-like protein
MIGNNMRTALCGIGEKIGRMQMKAIRLLFLGITSMALSKLYIGNQFHQIGQTKLSCNNRYL